LRLSPSPVNHCQERLTFLTAGSSSKDVGRRVSSTIEVNKDELS
jgi:hypothetical protein